MLSSWHIAFITIYCLFYFILLAFDKRMIFLLSIFIGQISMFCGISFIEGGAYISEQLMFGFPNGSFGILALFAPFSLLSFFLFSKPVKIDFERTDCLKLYLCFSLACLLLVVYVALKNPHIYANPNITRFIFFDELPMKRLFKLFWFLYASCYIFCIIKEKSLARKLLYFAIYCVILFITGEKTGGYIEAIVWVIFSQVLYTKRLRDIPIGLYILSIIIFVGAMYMKLASLGNMVDFFNRFVLNGHVFWGAVNYLGSNGPAMDLSGYIEHFFSMSMFRTNPEYGFGALMYAISDGLALGEMDLGVRFSCGYPAILLYHFGYVGAFFLNLILFGLFALFVRFFIYILRHGNFLIFILFMKCYNGFEDLLASGEYGTLKIKYFLIIVTVFALLLVVQLMRKRKRPIMRQIERQSTPSISVSTSFTP